MHSHELLREVFQTTSAKQISADLGLSLSMIYKWAEPPDHASGSGASNRLDRIEALLRSTNDPRIVHWIAMLAAHGEQHDPLDRYGIDIFTQARPKKEDKILVW